MSPFCSSLRRVAIRPETDFAVDAEGEVQRRGPAGQLEDIPPGAEHEHLVPEEIDLEGLHELLGVGNVLFPDHDLAQPLDHLGQIRLVGPAAFLVAPVGGNTALGVFMHFVCAYLDLKWALIIADHNRMDRLVEVCLGRRNVVIELLRNMPP